MAKTERIQNMTKGSPAKLIFTFAIPLMLGNVFQQFYTCLLYTSDAADEL